MLDVFAAGAALTGLVALVPGGTVDTHAAAPAARPSHVSTASYINTAAPAPVKMSLVAAVSAAAQSADLRKTADVPPPADGQKPADGHGDGHGRGVGQTPAAVRHFVGTHRFTAVRKSGAVTRSNFGHRSSSVGGSGHNQRVIMIIRHGEKPGKGGGHGLTSAGWARAQGLTSVFGGGRGGFAAPRAIFAAGATKSGKGQRTRETVSPLSSRLGVPVNSAYGKGQEAALARAAIAKSQNGPVLISWQHGEIPAIAKALKVVGKKPSGWSKGNFDGVWKFTWTPKGWVFSEGSEGLGGGKSSGKSGGKHGHKHH